MTRQDLVRLSKTVSHALRHAPWVYELELDEEGWTPVGDLLYALQGHRKQWHNLTLDDLVEMTQSLDKQRFEIKDDRIRAFYGHSIPQPLKRTPAQPPDILYHGTGEVTLGAILRDGLKAMRRQHVHLSSELETAKQVGDRKQGKTRILVIQAIKAYVAGVEFYAGNEMVWLSDPIPPDYLRLLDE